MGDQYYPDWAWDDFVDDFETIQDAKLAAIERKDRYDWYQIVDTETKKVCKDGMTHATGY